MQLYFKYKHGYDDTTLDLNKKKADLIKELKYTCDSLNKSRIAARRMHIIALLALQTSTRGILKTSLLDIKEGKLQNVNSQNVTDITNNIQNVINSLQSIASNEIGYFKSRVSNMKNTCSSTKLTQYPGDLPDCHIFEESNMFVESTTNSSGDSLKRLIEILKQEEVDALDNSNNNKEGDVGDVEEMDNTSIVKETTIIVKETTIPNIDPNSSIEQQNTTIVECLIDLQSLNTITALRDKTRPRRIRKIWIVAMTSYILLKKREGLLKHKEKQESRKSVVLNLKMHYDDIASYFVLKTSKGLIQPQKQSRYHTYPDSFWAKEIQRDLLTIEEVLKAILHRLLNDFNIFDVRRRCDLLIAKGSCKRFEYCDEEYVDFEEDESSDWSENDLGFVNSDSDDDDD